MKHPGIYKIVNKITDQIYIGSAVNLYKRKNVHFSELRRDKHCNGKLQESWNTYGEDYFEFVVIENIDDAEELLDREQHYLDLLDPHYNICVTAGSRLGTPHTPEIIEKIRQNATKFWLGKNLPEETKKKIGDANRGNQHTQEAIDKITINNSRYWKGKTRSTEAKEKMAKAKVKPISQYTLDGQFIRSWDSGKHVQNETGMSQGNVNKVCLGKYKQAYGFIWKFE